MLYVLVAMSAIVAAMFICRYYAAKTRLVEKEIEKAIARRVATSDKVVEFARIREENAVMRNLLLDLLENEASLPVTQSGASPDDVSRLKFAKIQRYREILAESQHFVRQSEATVILERAQLSANPLRT